MLRYWLRPASLPALLCAALLLLGLYYPAASLNASVRGLTIWWEVLFPALFPFFVLSELMLGFGIVHFFGTLMDPLMRPLFRLPGISGFVVAMGYISGYPVGARLTAQLRERGQITQAEGERMVAFTTTSDPIFLIGAVSVGFFHNAALALVLAAAHYGSGLIIGLLARFHEPRAPGTPPAAAKPGSRFLLSAAVSAMHEAMQADGRKLGRLLQDAIGSALRLMTVVGGLVVFFWRGQGGVGQPPPPPPRGPARANQGAGARPSGRRAANAAGCRRTAAPALGFVRERPVRGDAGRQIVGRDGRSSRPPGRSRRMGAVLGRTLGARANRQHSQPYGSSV